jgi:hypothetical protein
MRKGETEHRTGMNYAKRTGCEMGSQGQVWVLLLIYPQYQWVWNPMRKGETERRTGMNYAKRTGCEMGSQGQDGK